MQLLILTQAVQYKNDNQKLEECIAQMAMGDTGALHDFYTLTSHAVYCFALSVVKNEPDAQDVLQDTYIKAFSAAGAYKAMRKPMAWLLTITRNLALMTLRERKKTDDDPFEEHENIPLAAGSLTEEDKLVLHAALSQIPPDESRIVILHAVGGLKHREIAKLLEIALPTVLSKYNRALKKLKKLLGEGY